MQNKASTAERWQEVWVTSDKDRIRVADMDEEHVRNALCMVIRNHGLRKEQTKKKKELKHARGRLAGILYLLSQKKAQLEELNTPDISDEEMKVVLREEVEEPTVFVSPYPDGTPRMVYWNSKPLVEMTKQELVDALIISIETSVQVKPPRDLKINF